MCRLSISRVIGVPARRAPRPMWWSRLLWRRVTLPPGSISVVADPVVGRDDRPGRHSFRSGAIGLHRGAPVEGAVRQHGVVVAGESVQLVLQPGGCGRRRLCGEPFLLGLVEPFHLAAGLRMVGPGMADPDAA